LLRSYHKRYLQALQSQATIDGDSATATVESKELEHLLHKVCVFPRLSSAYNILR
jgi:hypothetical protein